MTVESLYPFLYGDASGDLVADLTVSTEAKLHEIAALRAALDVDAIAACAVDLASRLKQGARLFTFGNGGSATDAQAVAHLFLDPPMGTPFPAQSLSADPATVTALANDVGFEVVFARQLAALARPIDVALALSTSGGSENVLRALDEARRMGLLTIGFAGHGGGRMVADHRLVVESASVHRIQEVQTTQYHLLWEAVQCLVEAEG